MKILIFNSIICEYSNRISTAKISFHGEGLNKNFENQVFRNVRIQLRNVGETRAKRNIQENRNTFLNVNFFFRENLKSLIFRYKMFNINARRIETANFWKKKFKEQKREFGEMFYSKYYFVSTKLFIILVIIFLVRTIWKLA